MGRLRPGSRFVMARMAIFCSPSSFFDGADVSFQFYGCNRITWHLHLLKPCGQGALIRSLDRTRAELLAITRPMFIIMAGVIGDEKPYSFLRELIREFNVVVIDVLHVSTT